MKDNNNRKVPLTSRETNDEINYQCNFFGFRLPFFDRLGNVVGFTAFYSLGALFTQTLAAYIGSQIPTLEKQFGLSSYESGIIMTFNDIGFLLCIVIVSAIPRLVHVPRWLFGTMLLFSVAGLICSLPHFIFPPKPFDLEAKSTTNNTEMSKSQQSSFVLCSDDPKPYENSSSKAVSAQISSRQTSSFTDPSVKAISVALIGIGMVLQGVAKAPRSPFTTVYLDDGCDKRKTGFFLGIIIGSSIFGPALSYGVGGLFSRIYVTLEDVDMSPTDPRWLGAWWLGFVVFGGLTLIFALPMLCFPRYLADKNSANSSDREKKQLTENGDKTTRWEKFKERALSYVRVVKCPVYSCLLLSTLLNWCSLFGKIVFAPKYVAAQFGIPLWKANIIVSTANLVTVSVGTVLGGTITRRVKMTPRRTFQIIVILFLIQTLTIVGELFLGCNQPNIVGPNRFDQSGSNISESCGCESRDYFPVCGNDGTTYHSPCYAGCSNTLRNGRMFVNCTSIPEGEASAGLCPFDCNTLIPYIIVNVIGSFIGALSIMPTVTAKLRCVEDRDKGTGIGLNSTLGSLLVAIPIPIMFGKVIDTTCQIWSSSSSRRGACALYNIDILRFRMIGLVIIFKICSFLFILLTLKMVWNIADWNDLTKDKSDTNKSEDKLILVTIKVPAESEKVANET